MSLTKSTSNKTGKGCGTVFFGIFAVAGLIFFAALCKLSWDAIQEQRWQETDCTIIRSRLVDEMRAEIDIAYVYQFAGQEFTGTKWKTAGNTFHKISDAQRALRKYPEDSKAKCFVNPSAPEQSTIHRNSLWIILSVLFPLIFVAIGVGGIIAIWRHKPAVSISDRALKAKNGGRILLFIFSFFFTAAGGTATYFIFFKALGELSASHSWQETPCVITSSSVQSHRGDKGGSTYSIEIQYRYHVEGSQYIGDRYNFNTSTSSNRKWRDEVVRNHPPGKETVCFVNPDDPLDAVLVRETGGMEWFGLIPLVFVIVGVVMFIAAIRMKKAKPQAAAVSSIYRTDGSGKLKTSNSPLGGCIALGIFGAIWNGIILGIFFTADLPPPAKLFLSIFVLIGIGIIVGAFYQFLALFNPKPELTVMSAEVPLGGTLQVSFRLSGNVKRISLLKISLLGREEATYRRGTNTVTDKSVFAEVIMVETRDPAAMTSGVLRVDVPAGLMHSFEAGNNKIVWQIRVYGEIAKWPDLVADYPITVRPAAPPVTIAG